MNNSIPIRTLLIIITMAFIAAGCNPTTPNQKNDLSAGLKKGTLHIGNHSLAVEIADNDATREQGLGGRESLAADTGMVFIFQKEDKHGFWMKDTNFPLDFIWIRDGKVVEITDDVPTQPNVTESGLKVYTPKEPVDWMLEVNAGFAAKNNIKVGDIILLDQ